ncbi:CPBP family glutamic-type intramembrane protease (plasmid) [Haladaptatus sp. SPP-AMP-3]|uniref:CPBP family intramembrane glutamic endopeptidase n=1 Tax=Haladaptatus sp. SPP-AMP-3 TaxID=3121295 RepID=UPI003C30062F
MPSPNWNAFAGVTLVVLVVLIALARASQAMFVDDEARGDDRRESANRDGISRTAANGHAFGLGDEGVGEAKTVSDGTTHPPEYGPFESAANYPNVTHEVTNPVSEAEFTPGTLLVNVALSQGLFGVVLVVAAVLAAIPADALGLERVTVAQLGIGVLLGVGLYAANEVGQRVADTFGIDYDDGLRELLTPDALGGWVVLLALVLPIIAGFEELLFRSSLVGVFAAGYGISPWFLVVASSVAFATGHGAQGPAGVLVTGTLGAVLASAFVLTGSLVVVVVAHYLVNALEFVVHAHGDSSR